MITKQCEECGKSFQVNDGKRNWQSIKLCSRGCVLERAARGRREKYIKQKWPQIFTCEWCNEDFPVNNGSEKSRRKYCSRTCYLAKRRDEADIEVEKRKEKQICLSCGAAFLPAKYSGRRQKYCSKTCFRRSMWQIHGIPRKTDKDFARVRKHVLKNFKGICQFCKSTDGPKVHHLDGDHTNNTYDNLTITCKKCHDSIHRISLIKINGEWKVSSTIFKVLGLSDNVKINP